MKLERRLAVLFFVAFGLAALVVVAAWFNLTASHAARAAANHALRVQAGLQAALNSLIDLETGQRGYVLSGDEAYLQPFQTARTNLPAQIAGLQRLWAADAEQSRRLAQLNDAVTNLIRYRAAVVEARRAQGAPTASQMILTGQGKVMMDSARGLIDTLHQAEVGHLAVSQSAAQAGTQRLLVTMAVLSTLVVLVLLGGWWLARHHLRQRQAAENERNQFFEQSLDPLCVAGVDGRFQRVNPAFSRILGWSAEELLSRPFIEFVHPDDCAATQREYERQAAGEAVVRFDNRYRCKDGSYRLFSWRATPIVNGKIYAVARDVTELRAAEERLRRSEENLTVTLRSIGDAVLATDVQGRVTRLNPVAEQLTGWREAEALGRPVAEVFHIINETTRQPAAIPVEKVLASGFIIGLANHTTLVARDGTECPIADSAAPIRDARGEVVGVVLVFRDVREERQAELALQRSAAEIADLYHHAPCGYHSLNAEGVIVAMNDTELQWLGFTRDEVVGKLRLTDLIVPPDRHVFTDEFPRLRERGWVKDIEVEMVRKDGTAFSALINATAIRDAQGRFVASRSTVLDITARKRAEQSRRSLLRAARAIIMRATVTAPEGWNEHPPEWGAERYHWDAHYEDEASAQEVLPLELQPGEHYANGWARAKHRDDWHPMNLVAAKAFVTGATTWQQELRAWDRHGRLHWFFQTALLQPLTPGHWSVTTINLDITARKQAEQALQEARDYAENIVQTVQEPLVILAADLRIRSANRAFYEMFRTTPAETEGHLLPEWGGGLWNLPELRARLERVIPENAPFDHLEVEISSPVIGRRSLQISGRKVFRPGNSSRLILLAIEDVSGPKQLEIARTQINETLEERVRLRTAQLEEANRLLRLSDFSVNHALVGIVWTTPDGRVIRTNQAYADMLGYTEMELRSLSISEFNLDVPREAWPAHCAAVRENQRLVINCRLRRKDGQIIPTEIERDWLQFDHQEFIVSFVRDISDRLQAEQRLQAAKQFSDELINSVPGVFFCFTPEGRFLRWNRVIETLLEYPAEQIATMSPLEFVAPEDRRKAEEKIRETFAQGHSQAELTLQTRSGRRLLFQLSSRVVTVDGQPALLGTGLDISERKNAERQMLRAQRMESIGALASGIAHDLNNALAPVMMGLSLLRENARPDATVMLDTMEASAKRGADMVRQLLTFGKGVEGRRLLLQPRHLLKEMEKIIKSTFPKNILLQTNVGRQVDTVLGDPTQLHQVLLNLCVNARDAMPEGGTLILEVANVAVDEAYSVTGEGAKPGRYVVWRVTDTGEGIPPEVLEHMFEPFFTTKSPDKGTGLGLSTVIGIVRSHGGFIQVNTKVGQGSSFSVFLPAQSPGSDTEKMTRADVEFHGHGETVLVVEDDASVRRVTCAILERLRFKVITAADGAEALVRAAENQAALSLVITDAHMPHMDGLTFARALRHMIPEVKLVVMSGRLDDNLEREFRKLGMAAALLKPFTHEKLVSVIQRTLASVEADE
ncbi:MAG TPA: PAS domain S-box protein [Verrucomicrobiae bacterium]|nr:PAS domain S-box protein [Verrucomicrobiae bacterium]